MEEERWQWETLVQITRSAGTGFGPMLEPQMRQEPERCPAR